MKTKYLKVLIAIILMGFSKMLNAQDPNFHIYLCFGQSNMAGAGDIEAQDRTVNSRFQFMKPQDCPSTNQYAGNWYQGIPPLWGCTGGLGPSDYFARTMVDNLPSNVKVGVVVVGIPGCKIELFGKTGYQGLDTYNYVPAKYNGSAYAWLLDLAKKAQQAGVIKGILLHQGESNNGDQLWPQKVKGVYDNLIADLNLNASQTPLLAGELLYQNQGGICWGHNSIIAKLPSVLPNSYVISADGLTGKDQFHFNSAGYRTFGVRYAQKMLAVSVNNGCTPSAITPYIQVNGGAWAQTNTASLNAGSSVTFGPQPLTAGSWQWTGPNGFTASTREIILSNVQSGQAGNYVATYTNSGGCKSSSTFALTVIPVTSTSVLKTPAMGWASWNQFGVNINESIIKKQADAMVSSGLSAKGFKNINIDDGFFDGRNSDGSLRINATKFPNGMKYLADYIHSKGLNAGFYSDAGSNTCGNVYSGQTGGSGGGMYNHDQQDADLFFKTWGFDFLKVDYCGGQQLKLDEKTRYTAIKNAILNTGRNVNYNVCRWQFPGTWVTSVADSWRMSTDINFSPGSTASWSSVVNIINQNKYLAPYSSPGHYNDMDMLEVGRGLTFEEDKSHFTMWCMLSSPLILGCDLTTISSQTKSLLTNSEVIGVNQDTTGPSPQAYLISEKNNLQVWVKKLNGRQSKERAVALFNQSNSPATITVKWKDLNLVGPSTVRDLWAQTNLGTMDSLYSTTVPAHGVILLKVVGTQAKLQEIFEGEYAWLNNFNLTQFAAVIPDQARASADASCSGGAKASYVGNRSDNYMEFRDIYADVAGRYNFTLTYISGENRTATVQVNGKDTLLTNLNSGGWGTLKNSTFPVTLKKGYNIIRISNANGWLPDIDKIYIDLNKYNVKQNSFPLVNLTSPANNAVFTLPASISISANASDADGTISNVQFYNGTTLLGSDATSPYSFTWSNVAAGTYSLTAKATDNSGATSTSAAVSIIVNACTPTAITPYTQLNGGAWNQVSTATLDAGGTVTFGPQPLNVGSWSWTGPNGFTATTREITISAIQTSQAGNYVATYTNTSGCKSTQTFSVTVTVPTTIIQCETACSVDGTLNETFNTGFHGTGYVNTDNFIGASARWVVNSPTAQTINLGIRYAHTTSAGRPMSLSVNGVTQVSNIAFGPTASNTTWVVSTVQITLAAGANTIKFVSTTAQGSPYMDELVYGGSVTAGSCSAARMSIASSSTVQSTVAPNPSSDLFTLTVQESVQSFSIVNDMGILVYTGGPIEERGSVNLGESLSNGLYLIRIEYMNGTTEIKKIQKSR